MRKGKERKKKREKRRKLVKEIEREKKRAKQSKARRHASFHGCQRPRLLFSIPFKSSWPFRKWPTYLKALLFFLVASLIQSFALFCNLWQPWLLFPLRLRSNAMARNTAHDTLLPFHSDATSPWKKGGHRSKVSVTCCKLCCMYVQQTSLWEWATVLCAFMNEKRRRRSPICRGMFLLLRIRFYILVSIPLCFRSKSEPLCSVLCSAFFHYIPPVRTLPLIKAASSFPLKVRDY